MVRLIAIGFNARRWIRVGMWGKTRGKKTAREEGENVERSADARISNENVKPG